MSDPEIDISKLSNKAYRLETFDKSIFEKNRRKCTPQNMAEAGFYYTPTDKHDDMVKCYACGIEVFGWNKNDDDPWTEHEKVNCECLYVKRKKSYETGITILDFIDIEKYRFLRLDVRVEVARVPTALIEYVSKQKNYMKKRKQLINAIDKLSETINTNESKRSKSPLREHN